MNERTKILDIAMNLTRLGNWAADGYEKRKERIKFFLEEVALSFKLLDPHLLPPPLRKTLKVFQKKFALLEKEGRLGPKDELLWAEEMLTWGNILTHRASLIYE